MSLIAALASFVVVIIAAAKGIGYRGAYVAAAVVAIALAVITFASTGAVDANAPEAERVGAVVLNTYGPAIGGWCLVTGVGLLVGALAFRPRRA